MKPRFRVRQHQGKFKFALIHEDGWVPKSFEASYAYTCEVAVALSKGLRCINEAKCLERSHPRQ